MVWECFTGLKEKAFNNNADVHDDEIDDCVKAEPDMKTEHFTSIRNVIRTNENGETETFRITEEKKIVNGVEEIVSCTESKMEGNGQINAAKPGGGRFKIFGLRKKSNAAEAANGDVVPAPDLDSFRSDALKVHNDYRKQHKAPAMKLTKELNDVAQEWAESIAKCGNFTHRPENKFGENIFGGFKSSGNFDGNHVVNHWYDECKDYDFKNPGFTSQTGHFTQVVWKGSKELGIGKAIAPNGYTYVVANYGPPGNIHGQFDKNVMPIKKGFF